VIATAKRSGRRLVRRVRGRIERGRIAWERAARLGWRDVGARAARRLTSVDYRQASAAAALVPGYVRPRRGAVFDVIYAIGYWLGEPKRYRVFNLADGLRAGGYSVHVMPFEHLDDIVRYRWRATILVLFRAEYNGVSAVDDVLGYARSTGMRLVYDIDDLVFEPARVDDINATRRMGAYERRCFIEALKQRRALMLACDLVTASTVPLARCAGRLGRPTAVIPNSINNEQLRVAAEIMAAPRQRGQSVIVGYFSGSPTHQRDFIECERALLDIMEQHSHVRFRLVGYLELGPEWDRYRDRIQRIDFLPAAHLLQCIAETDINLAPVELGNPFCEAKSELKFFEAAIVGVSTVASVAEPFVAAIEDGVSGLLVRDVDDWRRALDLLITCEDRRNAMGQEARTRALARYGPGAVVPQVVAALNLPAPGSRQGCAPALG
jgi:glycosyltransferase involved in cell wall biosynthesis